MPQIEWFEGVAKAGQDFITSGQETVGLRVPGHPIALALIKEFNAIGVAADLAPMELPVALTPSPTATPWPPILGLLPPTTLFESLSLMGP